MYDRSKMQVTGHGVNGNNIRFGNRFHSQDSLDTGVI